MTIIDCDTCPIRGRGCAECFVSYLSIAPTWLDDVPAGELSDTEVRAIDALAAGGLVQWPGTSSAAG